MVCAQGGVAPKWLQGSSVVNMIEPRARAPASRSASTSACGRPPRAVTALAMISPVAASATTAPTEGFGDVAPRLLSARKSARRIKDAITSGASGTSTPAREAAPKDEAGISVITARPAARLKIVAKLDKNAMEILRLAEIAIHARIADIGHAIERLQPLHDEFADVFGGDLGFIAVLKRPNDGTDKLLDAILAERALPERDLDGAPKLFAVEGSAPPAPFDDGKLAQLHALERRKPRRACRAGAATSYGRVIL